MCMCDYGDIVYADSIRTMIMVMCIEFVRISIHWKWLAQEQTLEL